MPGRQFGVATGLFVALTIATSCSDLSVPTAIGSYRGIRSNVVGPEVVISQVYGGGGNSGATLKNDFIELFNPGASPVSLAGWSVQYASASGTTWQRTILTGTIEPGRYYLVQQAAGSGGTVSLPAPDATGSIAMAAGSGKVVLVRNTTTLSGSCPLGSPIADIIGYGSANCAGTTPALSNTTALVRRDDGCTWTGTAADFEVSAPAPRNSASPANDCGAEPPPPPPPPVRFSELHYDNVGVDVGEFVEIEAPAATDLTGWQLVLYNGSSGAAYDTRTLGGAVPDMCGGRGVVVLTYEQDGVQNGSPDGMALVDATGSVVEFLSYEGTVAATDGPAAGTTSTNIGVSQSSTTAHFQTLQRLADGTWEGPVASSRGNCRGTPLTPHNQVSFSGREKSDMPLPVDFEGQIFATLRDPANISVPATFTWEALTPAVATIDGRGVMHALAAGTATFRATANDGSSATYSLPTMVATPSTTALYANHAEFGEPADADASDDYILRRREYTSSFNRARGIPNWVSYNLEATHIVPGQDRCDCFTYDPLLPADFPRYTTADYTGAGAAAGFGIDRGHLARSFDRTAGSLDNANTFLFTNIIPQASHNNQGPWGDFETWLGAQAQSGTKELFIIAGASGDQGTVKGEGKIVIPAWTWKVAVIMPRDRGLPDVNSQGDVEVVAVIMPNVAGILNDDWQDYRATVNAVEALSGYDVLALLDDEIERIVEGGLQPLASVIEALVADGRLSAGNGRSMLSKVEASAAALDRGNARTAVNQLEALANEVRAMSRSRSLSADEAQAIQELIAAAIATSSS